MASNNSSAMNASPLKKSVRSSSMMDYTHYKYSNIQHEWIICQGNLNYYRNDKFNVFNVSPFAIYYVVLAKIPVEDEKQIMGIYLYRNQKQKPSNFFQMNEYEKVSDQCSKSIKSKYFLFQLSARGSNDVEVFGGDDAPARDTRLMRMSNQIMSHFPRGEFNKSVIFYQQKDIPFSLFSNRSSDDDDEIDRRPALVNSSKPSEVFQLPHRPAPPIPNGNRSKATNNIQQLSPVAQNARPRPKKLPQFSIRANNVEEEEEILPKEIPRKKSSPPVEDDTVLTWEDVFYDNKGEDHAQVLNEICQIGAFLVRPQSKKSNSKGHDYTLSIFAFGGIIKYKILKLSTDEYCLVNNNSQPSFTTIAQLCRYYTSHQLPHSIPRDGSSKTPVGNLCLKMPYTYYLCRSIKF